MKPFDSRGYLPVSGVRLVGARLHVHWSAMAAAALLLALWVRHPAQALAVVAGYFGVILLHEIGHAAMARRLRGRATDIRLALLHGECEYRGVETRREDALVAWGGVLAQLAVALPLLALSQWPAFVAQPLAGIAVAAFGWFSLFVAAVNLAPMRGLDGARAWPLLPILLREWRARGVARKTARALMQRLK